MKLIVIVDGQEIAFEGQKVSAYHEVAGYLLVNDLTFDPPKKVATFRSWDYWRYE